METIKQANSDYPRLQANDERIDWHLDNWAVWMRGKGVSIGFNSRSPIIGRSGSSDFDAMVATADTHCAVAVDAMIDDLPKPQHLAVYNIMLGTEHKTDQDSARLFDDARQDLARGLVIKGIW